MSEPVEISIRKISPGYIGAQQLFKKILIARRFLYIGILGDLPDSRLYKSGIAKARDKKLVTNWD